MRSSWVNCFGQWSLRYGFPGTVTATLLEAFYIEKTRKKVIWHHPLFPYLTRTYEVSGFGNDLLQCPGDAELTFPTVVNNRPGQSRVDLQRIAEKAKTIEGHYRFYAYTNGAISQVASYNEPDTNRTATVCSTFIWTAAKLANVTLEGALEAGEWPYDPDNQTLDGLYFYPERIRKLGAQALYSHFYNEASRLAGNLGVLGDVPDDVASQFVNCFASDYCSENAKDSDRWKSPGAGRTVSPDNLLLWDAPYGHNERLVLRHGKYNRTFRWGPEVGSGAVKVTVVDHNEKPVPNARVLLDTNTDDRDAITDSNGTITFSPVSGGRSLLEARMWYDGTSLLTDCPSAGTCELLKASGVANVTEGQTEPLTLRLPAPKSKRLVSVNGSLYVKDYDGWLSRDEDGEKHINKSFVMSSLKKDKKEHDVYLCVDGEVDSNAHFDITLLEDNSAKVTATLWMEEGYGYGTCDRGDGRKTVTGTVYVDAGQSNIPLDLEAKDDGGRATLHVTLSNLVAP